MTALLELLQSKKLNFLNPFFIDGKSSLCLRQVIDNDFTHLDQILPGDVVALIGDFNSRTITDMMQLIERKTVLVPLTSDTRPNHHYFFEAAHVNWVVENGIVKKINNTEENNLLVELRKRGNPGLVLFSTGTTGKPKAILHDFSFFLQRYLTPRPSLTTLNFLLFDHIGGINTLFHSMFNSGLVVSIHERSVEKVLGICYDYNVEVLPTTPTFLRMMLLSGLIPDKIPESLKIITYGTERMDEFTLHRITELLPDIDFRQTYGMSELGILRVKSESKSSLFMKIGGEGVTWKEDHGVLKIKSPTRMMGYLNSLSPFDPDGWYDTKDLVEVKGEFIKVIGRTTEVVNIGGLKFLTSQVESVAMTYPGIFDLSISVKPNPVTGQHIEMVVELDKSIEFNFADFKEFLRNKLPRHMLPSRISIGEVKVNHRFKRE